jgi:hypothetical protein
VVVVVVGAAANKGTWFDDPTDPMVDFAGGILVITIMVMEIDHLVQIIDAIGIVRTSFVSGLSHFECWFSILHYQSYIIRIPFEHGFVFSWRRRITLEGRKVLSAKCVSTGIFHSTGLHFE